MALRFFVLSSFLVATTAHALTDLAGAYDLGPRAAAMVLRKDVNEMGESIGILTFCRRQTLLEKQLCTGASMPIRCKVSDEGATAKWTCEEGGNYPFLGVITAISENRVHYKFKSSFNEGELEGTRLPIDVQ
jgi:hypothetical protein